MRIIAEIDNTIVFEKDIPNLDSIPGYMQVCYIDLVKSAFIECTGIYVDRNQIRENNDCFIINITNKDICKLRDVKINSIIE